MRISVPIHTKDEHNFPWWKNKLSLLQHAHTDYCLGRCSVNRSEKGCVCIWITHTANMHNSGSILFRFHYLQTQGVMQLPDLWGKWYSTEKCLHIQQSYCVEPDKPLTYTQSLVNTIHSLWSTYPFRKWLKDVAMVHSLSHSVSNISASTSTFRCQHLCLLGKTKCAISAFT